VHLRQGVREHFLDALRSDWPDEVARYEELFARGAYLPSAHAEAIRDEVRSAARAAPITAGFRRIEPRRPVLESQLTLAV
jgi:hypothetical protein